MAAEQSFTQARIRVNEEGSTETVAALQAHEGNLLVLRKIALDEGFTDLIPVINRKLGATRRVIEEAARTMEQQGW